MGRKDLEGLFVVCCFWAGCGCGLCGFGVLEGVYRYGWQAYGEIVEEVVGCVDYVGFVFWVEDVEEFEECGKELLKVKIESLKIKDCQIIPY